jgi:hypothetical protein
VHRFVKVRYGGTPEGRPVPRHQVQGHHIVSVGGMTMRAQDAASNGFLEITSDGRYVEAGGSTSRDREPGDKSEEPAPGVQSEAERLADPDRDLKFLEAVSNADPDYVGDVLNESIEAAVEGTGTSFDAQRVAAALGITPQQAEQRFAGMVGTYQSHVDSAVREAGVEDVAAFYSYLRANRANTLRDALRRVTHDGNVSDFEQMARHYVAQGLNEAQTSADANDTDYAAEDILSADFGPGISAGQGSDGTVYLLIKGHGTVTFADAVRKGLVRVSQR